MKARMERAELAIQKQRQRQAKEKAKAEAAAEDDGDGGGKVYSLLFPLALPVSYHVSLTLILSKVPVMQEQTPLQQQLQQLKRKD
jgi:hypothetical protein